MTSRHLLLALGITAAIAGNAFAANRPSGFTTICNEGQTCAVSASTNVAFGRADHFLFRVLSGSFVCSEATFGGRTAGGVNECSVPTGSAPPDDPGDPGQPPNPPLGSFPGCAMPTPTATVQLTQTQVVLPGQVFDGGNRRYNLSGGSQSEGQPPVFNVMDGGQVRNVIIGPLAADGIHCLGNCTLDHVWWEDTGEDAATALGPAGTVMTVNCGAAFSGADKTFQFNGRGELRISNFYVADSGKLVRSCGDCTGNGGPRRIFVNNVITRDVPTVVGINTNFGDVANIRNVTLNNSGTSKTKICQVYKGVVKGQGSSKALGVEFNTPNCQVNQSDVTLLSPSQMNTSACAGSCPIP
jgi:pectate lyase